VERNESRESTRIVSMDLDRASWSNAQQQKTSSWHTFSPVTTQRALAQAEGRHTRGLCEHTRAQTRAKNAPDQGKKVPWRDYTRPSIPLQYTLRYDGCRRHGEESGIVTCHILIITHWSCTHSRSATWGSAPRRTIMDSKKKFDGRGVLHFQESRSAGGVYMQ
jgi:hypothetical protein